MIGGTAGPDRSYRLTRKVPRMPFPPKTDEAFFDYEATLDRTVGGLLWFDGALADICSASLKLN
jgi:hypothetical protein